MEQREKKGKSLKLGRTEVGYVFILTQVPISLQASRSH